ncbi:MULTISPECIES: YbaN family protein [unclassified Rhizobium]|uniref:YbaN family protein n=1 Tax=unclassified Rhizobium TaxID=2613769 RepID=UPI0015FF75FB|nr:MULTISPECIES: YbaN family protein [unclassified Rhizobium]MBB1249111.1 YbaN family protein [Rhizobium sp. G21]MCV3767072.1 YbaN family protein [Rhizobium sp. TRM95796]
MRIILIIVGWLCVALGVIGIFLPLLPTTPFILLAAWLFARASPRFERWLYEHRVFGPPLHAWRDNRSIPRRAKVLAIGMMAVSFASLLLLIHPPLWVSLVVGGILSASAVFVATRNEGRIG